MKKEDLTFNVLPQVVAQLRDEVMGMKVLLQSLQNRPTQQRENRHRPVTPERVAEYTNIPVRATYFQPREANSPLMAEMGVGFHIARED